MESLSPRRVRITADDRGPLLNLGAWMCMVIMCLAVLTRLGSKWTIARRFGLDDALISTAMALAVVATVAVSMQVTNGLGRHRDTLTQAQFGEYQKWAYVSEVLYVPTLALAKLSIVLYLMQLTPRLDYLRANQTVAVVIILWALAGTFAAAFQCKPPRSAVIDGKCFNQNAFWDAIGSFDLLTEIMMVALPVEIIWNLQMTVTRKFAVISAFACRIIIIPVIILRLVYLTRASRTTDRTWTDFDSILTTQVDIHFCVLVSCVPYLKPFMEGLPADCLTNRVSLATSSRHGSKISKGDSYAMNSMSSGTHKELTPQAQRLSNQAGPRLDDVSHEAHVTAFTRPARVDGDEADSRTSAGSDKMIIKQTKGWAVQYDEEREIKADEPHAAESSTATLS